MIKQSQIKALERVLKNRRYDSQAHAFKHLQRTAIGTKVFNEGFKTGDEAYAHVAGLLHEDYVNSIGRTLSPLGFDSKDVSKVVKSVNLSHKDYEDMASDKPARSVFLSNKLLEGDGAYMVFRRCYFCAESKDYIDVKPQTAILKRFREHKHRIEDFPLNLEGLVKEQAQWSGRFLTSFERSSRWALDMGERIFLESRLRRNLESVIENFEPKTIEQERYAKETLDYVRGRNYDRLKDLII